MTEAEQVEAEVLKLVLAEQRIVSLTRIATLKLPARLDFHGFDEISFVYPDGSRFVTGLVSDDEHLEATALRRLIEMAPENREQRKK